MYAYCIFAFLSLAISVCGELGMPISMGHMVLTVELCCCGLPLLSYGQCSVWHYLQTQDCYDTAAKW